MFKNYFKIAFRNIIRYKTYSFLNILGLTIGLACFILITLYIVDEISYDRYHQDAKRIYRVVNVYDDGKGVGERSSSCPFPVSPTLVHEYPHLIEQSVRLFNFQHPTVLIEIGKWKYNEPNFFFADSNIIDVFNIKFIHGNPETALQDSRSVIITEEIAKKYFKDANPVGKIITYNNQLDLMITGVIENTPIQSHFKYNFLASLSTVAEQYKNGLPKTWVWNPCWTYVKLNKGIAPDELNKHFPEFVEKYFYDAQKPHVSLYLQALTDIHLKSNLDYEIEPNGNITYIYILAAIAIFILIIAGINFMNLSTAFSTTRAKEIGIKKVIGIKKKYLIFQFLSEAIILTFIALFIALAVVELILPEFNSFSGKQIILKDYITFAFLIPLLAVGLIVGIFSGIYPAFYMSSFQPVQVLKGKFTGGRRNAFGRKLLVLTQFSISVTIIIVTLVAFTQLKFLKNADLGFNKSDIILIHATNTPVSYSYKDFKNEILNHPDIINVTASDDILGVAHNTHEFWHEGIKKGKWQFYPAMIVRDDFIETYDIKVVAGRPYSKYNKSDPIRGILINEAMVKHIGWTNEEALGKVFRSFYGKERVIGVISNFNVQSLHKPVGPFVLNMKEMPYEIQNYTRYISLKINRNNTEKVLAYLNTVWKEFAPDRPFVYSFLSDDLDRLYESENKLTKLAWIFALITILIACLGLYGLSSFMVQQRMKEIGIRKALGASTENIMKMIVKEFLYLSLGAAFFAWIVANIGLNYWLKEFSRSIEINFPVKLSENLQLWLPNGFMINMLLISGFIALFIAICVTGYKAFSASRINPVDTLRYE